VSAESQPDQHVTCECGSRWWEVHAGQDGDTIRLGTVAVDDRTGAITAYSALFFCRECGLVMPESITGRFEPEHGVRLPVTSPDGRDRHLKVVRH
jgi:hypothetical protein